MSVAPTYHHFAGSWGTVALVVALLALSVASGHPSVGAPPPGMTAASASSPCAGPMLPHNYTGTFVENGTSSVRSVTLDYLYDALQENLAANGSVVGSICGPVTGTITAAPGGSVDLSIDPTPVVNCTDTPGVGDRCLKTEGPYATVNLSVASPIPDGDFASVDWNGTAFEVGVYPYLASIHLDPGPTLAAFGPGTTDEISAEPRTGAGNATPFDPTLTWSLAGAGWSFVGGAQGPTVNVTAAPGADDANLTVVAALEIGGTTFDAAASESLLQIPISFASANLARTNLDVDQPVTVWANGTAAADGAYSATLRPGLNDPSAAISCASAPGLVGTVDFSCAATFAYSQAGVAQPSLSVSNGVSSATWTFPQVTVHPDPAFAFDPEFPVGYTNALLPISVAAVPGTGVAPYAQACLDPGFGAIECRESAGPSWTFLPTYPTPGNYSATAWTIDGAGTNHTGSTSVRIVAPLGVEWETTPTNVSVGSPVTIDAVVTGGDLPARIWGNLSGASNPVVSAWVESDGVVPMTFVPSVSGFATVSASVVDALGSQVTTAETFAVVVGAAAEAVASGLPPSSPVRAGTPFGVAWQALNAEGEAVDGFAASATIELAGADGAVPGTVNASGVGPLANPLPGWFDVPVAAWIGGTLNVSVSADVAGSIEVRLAVADGLASGTDPVPVTVVPDIDHLVLSDPYSVLATGRAGSTLWRVTDRFGNPATAASLVITSSWDGSTSTSVVPVLAGENGSTEAWVNYSIPGAWAGTVRVTDLAGIALLPTITVPGLGGALAALPVLPLVVALATGATLGGAVFVRRREDRGDSGPLDEEAELQRLAEGRSSVVEIVRRAGPIDLAGVATLWDPPPAPPDLADWIASLLTDGTLDAAFGADGVARFLLPTAPRPTPAVTVDVSEFDRAQLRREALAAEWDADER